MNSHTLSESAQTVLAGAREEAARLGHDAVGAEHILLSLLERGALAPDAFRAAGRDPSVAAERLRASSGAGRARASPGPKLVADVPPVLTEGTIGAGDGELGFTSYARRIMEVATREAKARGGAIGELHLLLAVLQQPRGPIAKLFADGGPGAPEVRAAVERALGGAPSAAPANGDADVGTSTGAPLRNERRARSPRPTRAPPTGRTAEPGSGPEPAGEPGREQRARGEAARGRRGAGPRSRERDAQREEPRPAPSLGKLAPKPKRPFRISWRGVLLVAVPVSVALNATHASPTLVFTLACLGVLPLAGYMGEATEHLAQRTGPNVGGLLNATFGNAAELIIAIAALRAGLVDLVKASITGSILGNLLLILGLAIVAGGVSRPELRFNRTTAGNAAGMLALAVVGLVFPALFHAVHPEPMASGRELRLSEFVAGILIITYLLSLLFTLRTHRPLFGAAHPVEEPTWSASRAVIVLAAATVATAVESEILVHATTAVTDSLGLSQFFLGLVVIPFIGNAAEHAAAVVVARKGQMDLALQIALGSSTQIALLVAPLLVFAGLVLNQPMNFAFHTFEVLALAMATVVNAILTLDGETHWFEGVQLLAVYAMMAAAAFFI
jgi:Ca2+:H+ antiporter